MHNTLTLDTIAQYLKNLGINALQIDANERTIRFEATGKNRMSYLIRLAEDGVFQMYMFPRDVALYSLTGGDETKLFRALAWMLHAGRVTRFGAWEYDPAFHQLRLAVEFPLEDNTLTQAQFKRVMSLMLETADAMLSALVDAIQSEKVNNNFFAQLQASQSKES